MGYFEKLSSGTRPVQMAQEPKAPPIEPVQEAQPVPAPQEVTHAAPIPAEQEPPKPAPAPDSEDTKEAPADDTAAREAHEAAEAKRKAEWDTEQEKKRSERQATLDKLATMSDEDVIKASTQRVGADVEKITRRNMKEMVAEHIQAVCQRNPIFARRTMLPHKSMIHCYWYINRMAKEYMEQEIKAENPNPASGMYGGDVPDDLVYQWAVDYFDADDVQEDKKDEEKFIPKPYVGKSGSKSAKKDKAKKEPKPAPKPKENSNVDGQISLLGEAV